MVSDNPYVIVGGGLAGAKAAETLREEGFEGRIVLIGDERELPYERPPLSKGYLLGDDERSGAYVHEEGWYGEKQVDLRTGRRVTKLDRGAHEVEFEDGERLGYAKLLLTTGASPRRLRIEGNQLDGVNYLRRLGHTDKLRESLSAGGRVVVVGAGWIGLETAAAARAKYGCEVTVIEPQPTPLHAVLGPELGNVFGDLHRKHGVEFRFGTGVTEFTGSGKVSGVRTDDGTELPADTVIVGVGARPNNELAEESGLAVDGQNGGVVVDAQLRTADPDVYAAGDVASFPSARYGRNIRVEHWANALNGGPLAARAMLGKDVTYTDLPYFFTDQYDLGMEYTGWFAPGGYDQVVLRGDVEGLAFYAFWVGGDRVVAGMHVNLWDDGIGPVQELINSEQPVDTARLADTSVPIADSLKS
ncbi:MAG TPA: FAD-dependent oxidoreductase [Actinophytocola sp.]|jgi:3-phenylpropionate/trans-cinnamate dioxygenase ferredoxin reductase subunit|uniref:NAD(P)/FAD-dependent oxidoreductase n=1 Tax=Actinophytocola sp. TaxID=1872138 RepID=UPI002F9423F7